MRRGRVALACHRIATLVAACTFAVVFGVTAIAARVVAPQDRPALMTARAAHSVLLGIANAGTRLVAVGERGIVILSDDGGRSWRQASVPVSITLTAVRFPTPREGWAVGHYGVVIHSSDGGETWRRQLTGDAAARLAFEAAQKQAGKAGGDARVAQTVTEAQRLVQEGADKPFLDLHFFDARNGIVVGAYNLIFRTSDGGTTWQPLLDRTLNATALHLYAIAAADERLYIAGEQGLLLRSDDRGETFTRAQSPYEGTFFAATARDDGHVVVAGLRGHAFLSLDRGSTWRRIDTPTSAGIAFAKLDDRALLLAGESGELLLSADEGNTIRRVPAPRLAPINAVAIAPDGGWVITGMRGAVRIEPEPQPVATTRNKP